MNVNVIDPVQIVGSVLTLILGIFVHASSTTKEPTVSDLWKVFTLNN